MDSENFGLALLLAKKAGLFGRAMVSTSGLAELTGFSQQSISRKLRALEEGGIISRAVSNRGIEVSLTENGRKELESFYLELKTVFSNKKFSIKGIVSQGLGEGAYYTGLSGYAKKFEELLGAKPFPGTLNLKVSPAERNIFTSAPPEIIGGFKTDSRSFGSISCWQCSIKNTPCLAILPHRTNHPDNILEVVAKTGLRKKLNLKDNSTVEVKRE